MTTGPSLRREDGRTGVSETHPDRNIECHHVLLTLKFLVSGMIMVAQPIGLVG